jgi:hypothetical protein
MLRIVAFYVLPILLAIYALIDCIQTDEAEIRGLPRIAWILLIVFVAIVGPVAWLVAGRPRRGRSLLARLPGLPPGDGGGGRQPRGRPLAPDDDPEFLGGLGTSNPYDRRLEEWEQQFNRPDEDGPGSDDKPDDEPGDPPAR